MRRIITLMIEDGKEQSTEVMAHSDAAAGIFITSDNMQDALTRLTDAIKEAQKACDTFTPVEVKQEEAEKDAPAPEYVTADDIIKEYQMTKQGQKIIKSFENAKAFRHKKETDGGMYTPQFNYLFAQTRKDTLHGLLLMNDYAFRKGYNRAVKDWKKKESRC